MRIGVVQLRRGSTAQTGTAAYYFSQASQTDPADADYFFNLGYAHWLDKDPPAAVYWLREAVRRDPRMATRIWCSARRCNRPAPRPKPRGNASSRRSVSYASAPPRRRRSGAARAGASEGLSRTTGARVDAMITSSGATRPGGAGRLSPRGRPPRLCARSRPRSRAGAAACALSVAIPGRGAPAAGPRPASNWPHAEAIQAFKIALWSEETRGRPRRAGRGLPAKPRTCRRPRKS